MFTQKQIALLALFFLVPLPTLLSQIVLQGTVTDNGAEYLGNGAEPVANALVTLIDQEDPRRSFNFLTNKQGQFVILIQTGVEKDFPAKTSDFHLLQNYPNPFNPSTVIGYEISQPSHVTIQVYSVLGRKVKTLLDDFQNSSGQVIWRGTDDEGQGVSAGVYVYSLEVNGSRMVRKMTLVDGHHNQRTINSTHATASAPLGNGGLHKDAGDMYTVRINGENIETWEQRDLTLTENLVLNISVIRTVTDVWGNIYRTVKIGNQWWMAEDLKVISYRNGEAMPNVTDANVWASLATGAWCVYNNSPANFSTYGLLYNWYAVNDVRNIAPAHWHVPTDAEWQILIDYLGGDAVAGGKMKEAGTAHWGSPNIGAANESGFFALPGGYRNSTGQFSNLGSDAYFWSSTESNSYTAWCWALNNNSSSIERANHPKVNGFSIRCVRD
ncbi:T9SS C-terminal target domain-containing protein [candidate division KSB1 bacterium]|nr:MAG: T9SS C-terminal target domain-containing protein [candidate division KSB1 bacterium]